MPAVNNDVLPAGEQLELELRAAFAIDQAPFPLMQLRTVPPEKDGTAGIVIAPADGEAGNVSLEPFGYFKHDPISEYPPSIGLLARVGSLDLDIDVKGDDLARNQAAIHVWGRRPLSNLLIGRRHLAPTQAEPFPVSLLAWDLPVTQAFAIF
jgi:hypothetical protein